MKISKRFLSAFEGIVTTDGLDFSQLFKRFASYSLVRSSGIYAGSNLILSAIPFLLLPILTRKLTPRDYGIVAMFQLVVSVIYPFIGMNLEGAIQRKFFDKDGTDLPSYVGSCFILVACSFLIVAGAFWANILFLQRIVQIPELWLKYVLIVAGCQFVSAVVLILYQVRGSALKYGIFQISQSLLNAGLTLFLVVHLNETWDGRLESIIATSVCLAIVGTIILTRTKQIRFNVKEKHIRHALKFGVPLIPHAIGAMLFTAIDRFFLTNLVGLDQTGNYSVAYQIGAVVSLITVAFNNAYIPWLFEKLNKDDLVIKKKIVKFTYLYFILIVAGAILLLLIFPFVVSIFVGHAYDSVNSYSAFIVFGFVFQGMYFMVTNYIAYAQKTYVQAGVTISVGILKIPITYFAIIWCGAIGASISYCITYFVFFIATWILSAKVYEMPWDIRTLLAKSN